MARQSRGYRNITIDRAKIDKEKRTVELSFSSEAPVKRWNGDEILSHRAGDYNFDRISSGNHPLLLGHNESDPESQIGVIESAGVVDGKGRAIVRFGKSAKAEEIFQDVQDGIRKNISVGYDRSDEPETVKSADGSVQNRYKWEPFHIAIVPVPADTRVGIGRSRNNDLDQLCPECAAFLDENDEACPACGADIPERSKPKQVDSTKKMNLGAIASRMSDEQKINMRILLDPNAGNNGGGTQTAAADGSTIERNRITAIRAIVNTISKAHPHTAEKMRELEDAHLSDGMPADQFRAKAWETAMSCKKPETTMRAMGVGERDIQRYNLHRALQPAIKEKGGIPKDGFEREMHDEMERRIGTFLTHEGFWMPFDARMPRSADSPRHGRDLVVGTFGSGGAFVPTVLETTLIEVLRNRAVLPSMGCTMMTGLTYNVSIPRQTAAATAYSLGETALGIVSTQVVDQISLVPHRIYAEGRYSLQLLQQSAIDVEGFVRDDLMKVLALKIDFLGVSGGGNADEPTGIVNQPGISSITFGGAPTFASIVNMETDLAQLNAERGRMCYVTSPSSRGILKQTAKTLTGATTVVQIAIWDKDNQDGEGEMNGRRAFSSNQILNNIMIFANWEDVICAMFGGFDVVVDPYTLASNAERRIVINTFTDFALRHPQSVCASLDAANQ